MILMSLKRSCLAGMKIVITLKFNEMAKLINKAGEVDYENNDNEM